MKRTPINQPTNRQKQKLTTIIHAQYRGSKTLPFEWDQPFHPLPFVNSCISRFRSLPIFFFIFVVFFYFFLFLHCDLSNTIFVLFCECCLYLNAICFSKDSLLFLITIFIIFFLLIESQKRLKWKKNLSEKKEIKNMLVFIKKKYIFLIFILNLFL